MYIERLERRLPSAPRPIVFLNGKFYSGAMNGVHRVADRLIAELDAIASHGGVSARWDMRLLLPAGDHWAPAFRHIRSVSQRAGHTTAWEQAVLPFAAWSGTLVSLANVSPLLHPAKLTMVHDAQFRISPRSYALHRRLGYRLLIEAAARTSRRVLTVSGYARDTLETFRLSARERTGVVYNGGDHILAARPDPASIARFALTPERYVLLFGSTAAYKNVRVVFEAFGNRALADLDLVVVGPSRATLAAHGIVSPPRACHVGTIPDAALRALYQGAACLAFPSRTEGFGLPPLEAMLCGCPVVAAPAGALPEICEDAVLYAACDHPAGWAERIARITHDADLRRAKIAQARIRAAEFTWAAAGKRLASEIDGLVRSRRFPAPDRRTLD